MPFTVSDGKIISPAGKPWLGYGINLNVEQVDEAVTSDAFTPLLDLWPGLGFIRLAFHSYTSATDRSLQVFLARSAAHLVPVICEDHTGISSGPYTGARLAQQNAWFASIASTYASNPYVWIGTLNEPNPNNIPAISVQQKSNYDAIRATGSKAIIAMELPGGGNPGTIGAGKGMDPAVYAPMTGIIWDLHYYGWVSGYSTDQAKVNAALAGNVAAGTGVAAAQTIRSADGLVPVIIGEYGDSTNGDTVDANATQVIKAVGDSKLSSTAWAWRPGGKADILTNAGNPPTLTSPYGREIAALIKANAVPTGKVPAPPRPGAVPGKWLGPITYQGMPYYVLLADGYDGDKYIYPTVLFLHQKQNESAEPGQTDPWFNTPEFRAAHPAIIIVPLCEINGQTSSDTFNWGGVTPELQKPIVLALQIQQQVEAQYSCDPARRYGVGNSMGGLGWWGVLCNPDQRGPFAAFVPVAGACYYEENNEATVALGLLQTPIWSCHGLADKQVPPQFDINMSQAMQKLGGIEKFSGIPGGDHDQWDQFFTNPATWQWLFQQAKGSKPVTPSAPYTQLTKPTDPPIIDTAGNSWGLIAAENQQITINGAPDTTTRNVTLVKWVPPLVWQSNAAGGAWSSAGPGQPWVAGTMPITPTQPPTQPPTTRPALQKKLDAAIALIMEVREALDNPLP